MEKERLDHCVDILEFLLKLSETRDKMENPLKTGDDIWCHQLKTCINLLKSNETET
tara:strand:+ start:89 stop:256 length:168 start_codon:yes stop_codon:yes gene_type:complete